MLHGFRRWVKITDSLLLPPLLLHEVIHVERESALRRPFGSVLTGCESLHAQASQMYTKVPPDGHVYSEWRVLLVLL